MKNEIKRILFAGALATLIAVNALAEVKSKRVTLIGTVTVNGIMVKAGMYDVEFDSEKNELSFVKNGKVVAKATAHTETAPKKAEGTRVETTHTDDGDLLTAITVNGKDQRIVLAGGGADAPSMK